VGRIVSLPVGAGFRGLLEIDGGPVLLMRSRWKRVLCVWVHVPARRAARARARPSGSISRNLRHNKSMARES
jgi:hypothetical protein